MINLKEITNTNYHGSLFAFSRSLLALGSLSTLLFNSCEQLFPSIKLSENGELLSKYSHTFVDKISIFSILSENLQLAKIITIAILILVLIGWRPKLTGILHWWASMSIFLSVQIPDGGDQITSNIALLLIPFTISDRRKWHWDNISKKTNNAYQSLILFSFLLIIKLQMSLLYFQAAVDKLNVIEWKDGTVLYYWFTHSIFGINDSVIELILPLFTNPLTSTILTWGILFLEILLFASIISSNNFKRKILFFGLFFHFCIFLAHGLFSFFIAMSGGLLLYLLPIDYDILKKIFEKKHHFNSSTSLWQYLYKNKMLQ